MSDKRFDTTVTEEQIQRDDSGVIEEIKLKMAEGEYAYITVCSVADGRVSFERVSPVKKRGRNITKQSTKKILSLTSGGIMMMNVEKTLGVLDAAQAYIDENYDEIDGKRNLWLSKDGVRGD